MIKKIKIELIIIGLLITNILVSSNIDTSLYKTFKDLSGVQDNIYLKQFFINITELGDSLWFFLISFFGYVFCYLLKIFFFNFKDKVEKFKNFFIFLFSSLLITGILTQIIKHIIGRPRPNHALENNMFGIDFLNFDSAFHSFPSGHASTIFVVALTLSLFTPKIKYFYFFYAGIVALSRVIVGAHYFTDIVGGIAVAFIGYKATLYLFKTINKKSFINEAEANDVNINIFFLSLIVFFIGILFVSVGSSIDIFLSSLFYQGQQTFSLESFDFITIVVRKIFLPFIILYLLLLPFVSRIFFIRKIYFSFHFSFKEVLFIFVSAIISNIFVVNLLLKNFWGRARPNDILELGGKGDFTPWFKYSDACSSNCSFVSGDTSVGFTIIILYFVTKNVNYFWLALFSGSFLGIIRIMEGGHFVSDVLLSAFLIFTLSFFQYNFYKNNFK